MLFSVTYRPRHNVHEFQAGLFGNSCGIWTNILIVFLSLSLGFPFNFALLNGRQKWATDSAIQPLLITHF